MLLLAVLLFFAIPRQHPERFVPYPELLWLVIGVFLMDAGVQGNQISNQTRIYALSPGRRNRINAVYMVCYFIGGALGSAIGSAALAHWQWTGVCSAGAALAFIGLVALFAPWPRRSIS
jgi:predicted MFS family arabinose efflux permease